MLGPGTHYLTLQDAETDNLGDYLFWGIGSGSSSAERDGQSISSESFQIYGTSGTVPEPATMLLLGLIGVAGVRRKFKS
jgi:hypothetical protein